MMDISYIVFYKTKWWIFHTCVCVCVFIFLFSFVVVGRWQHHFPTCFPATKGEHPPCLIKGISPLIWNRASWHSAPAKPKYTFGALRLQSPKTSHFFRKTRHVMKTEPCPIPGNTRPLNASMKTLSGGSSSPQPLIPEPQIPVESWRDQVGGIGTPPDWKPAN